MEIGDIVLMRDFKGVDHEGTVVHVHIDELGEETGLLSVSVFGKAPIPLRHSETPRPFTWRAKEAS